jgi:molecular chaperone GrpE
MTESNPESATERTIREALESVERLERARQAEASDNLIDPEPDTLAPEGPIDASEEVLVEGPASADSMAEEARSHQPKRTAADAVLEAMIAAKANVEEVLAQTQKEAKDLFERLARSQADFENYKKRQQRERDEAIKFGNEKLLKELLPVLDNLLRALSVAPSDEGTHSLMNGVKLVAKQFEDSLGKFGVQGFASQGLPFDPAKHEAVGARPDANVPAQHVLEEFQRGYLLQDRLLRPALVIVSSGPAEGGN